MLTCLAMCAGLVLSEPAGSSSEALLPVSPPPLSSPHLSCAAQHCEHAAAAAASVSVCEHWEQLGAGGGTHLTTPRVPLQPPLRPTGHKLAQSNSAATASANALARGEAAGGGGSSACPTGPGCTLPALAVAADLPCYTPGSCLVV